MSERPARCDRCGGWCEQVGGRVDFTDVCGCRYDDSGEGWNWLTPCPVHRVKIDAMVKS